MYVVGADEFDMLCYEDNETNRLQESLNCWTEIINSAYFPSNKSNVYLVFNKIDLFLAKMKNQTIDLAQFFKGYKPALFSSDPQAEARRALTFMINKFLGAMLEKRKVYVCLTNAIDMNGMKKFWKSVLNVPLRTQRVDDVDEEQSKRLFQEIPQYDEDIMLAEEWWWDTTCSQSSAEYSQSSRLRRQQEQDAVSERQSESERSPSSAFKLPNFGNIWNGSPLNNSPLRSAPTSPLTASPKRANGPMMFASNSMITGRIGQQTPTPQGDCTPLTRKPNKITSYPVGFIDTTGVVNSLQVSDMTLTTRDNPHVQLRVHSFVMSVRCPLFYEYIISQISPFSENVFIEDMNMIQLKHIVSFIYSNQPYPFACVGAIDGRESRVLKTLNERFQFMRDANTHPLLKKKKRSFKKSIKKIKEVVMEKTTRSASISGDRPSSPVGIPKNPSFFKKMKTKMKKTKNIDLTLPVPNIYDDEDGQEDVDMTDLFAAFERLNSVGDDMTHEVRILHGQEPDIILHGAGWDGRSIYAHRFIVAGHLPDLRNRDFALFSFYGYRSYNCVIGYLYGADMNVMLDSGFASETGAATCMDIVHMIHISRIWDLDREFELFDILLARLSKILTPTMAFQVFSHFAKDEIDLTQFVPQRYHKRDSIVPTLPTDFINKRLENYDDTASAISGYDPVVGIAHPATQFAILPDEILYHIFSYLVPPPLCPEKAEPTTPKSPRSTLTFDQLATTPVLPNVPTSDELIAEAALPEDAPPVPVVLPSWQQNTDHRMLNQDTLTFLLFTSIEFIHYMARNYKEYFIVKHESFGHFSLVRNACYEYMAKNWSVINQLPQWKEASAEMKKQVRDLLAEENPSSIFANDQL
jgi:hypothetical protein